MSSEIQNRKQMIWKKKMLFVLLVVVIGYIVFDMSGIGGNARFYAKWIECGQKPLIGRGSGFMNDGVSHYIEAPNFNLVRLTPTYFCTPIEAEREKYSADPAGYDFPHLRAVGEESPVVRDSRNDSR